jgi:hypothetical protein
VRPAERDAATSRGPVSGRIWAAVVDLWGFGGDTLVVVVEDRTARIQIWCPAGTSPWGPESARSCEFQALIAEPAELPRELREAYSEMRSYIRAGSLGPFQRVAEPFFGGWGPNQRRAVATDVRPLDDRSLSER